MALLKECEICHKDYASQNYSEIKNILFPSGRLPICKNCVENLIKSKQEIWSVVNKLCQLADIPFNIEDWEKIYKDNGEKSFDLYCKIYKQTEFQTINWSSYNEKYIELEKKGKIEDSIPGLKEEKIKKLQLKWGSNYCEEELIYLENLLTGIINSQNVNGALQEDQALKLCKISLNIDSKIRAGEEIDKLIGAYDKLTKTADFTPKNVKNASDFDSVGEIYAYLEKKGWINQFYQGEIKDEVDNTMKNIQSYVRKLYINESGISEEVDRKIEQLKVAKELEKNSFDYDFDENDADNYDKDAYDTIEEFEVDI